MSMCTLKVNIHFHHKNHAYTQFSFILLEVTVQKGFELDGVTAGMIQRPQWYTSPIWRGTFKCSSVKIFLFLHL